MRTSIFSAIGLNAGPALERLCEIIYSGEWSKISFHNCLSCWASGGKDSISEEIVRGP